MLSLLISDFIRRSFLFWLLRILMMMNVFDYRSIANRNILSSRRTGFDSISCMLSSLTMLLPIIILI